MKSLTTDHIAVAERPLASDSPQIEAPPRWAAASSRQGSAAPEGAVNELHETSSAWRTGVPSHWRVALPFQVVGLMTRISDFSVICLSSILAMQLLSGRVPDDLLDDYSRVTLLTATLYIMIAEACGANDSGAHFSVRRAWRTVLNAWATTALFTIAFGFLMNTTSDFSRLWGLSWFALGSASLALSRAGLVIWTRRAKGAGVFNQRGAIFGAGPQGAQLAGYILNHDKLTLSLGGFYDDRSADRVQSNRLTLPLLGDLECLVAAIRAGQVDQVIIALPWSAGKRLEAIVEKLAMTPVRIRLAPEHAGFIYARRPIVLLGELPVMTLFECPISGLDHAIKWFEDKLLALLLLAMSLPVMLVVAVAIKLDSRGPVLFRQTREGFNNQPFPVWKFRTMFADRCTTSHIVQVRRGDPRVTRVGAWLRRSSLDELPQLLNVLRGEMSLVGPRPHAPSTRAAGKLFSDVIGTYAARHKVKPGLTGWAQVCGWRGETDTEEKLIKRLEYDLYYIENWSLWFDLYIVIRTAATILVQRTAF